MAYKVVALPLVQDLESKAVLKKLPAAHAALAELKGIAATIPNVSILLNTLALQEAKDSSAVENIITTHDELFRAALNLELVKNVAAKEVQYYAGALKLGFARVTEYKLITNGILLELHRELEGNTAGYRQVPGTELKNDRTGETVYTPPQSGAAVAKLMANLIDYINDDTLQEIDPLIKMALIHHQFESIHPFYDGNGRTGRIINILYLVAKGLLDTPVLYLSRYIIQHKQEYYRLLQSVRDKGDWEAWILFMLEAVEHVSRQSIELIKAIKNLMHEYKIHIREHYKYYSQDLLNNLFRHPYTKIDFLQHELNISRQSASKYLNELAADPRKILVKIKIGRNYFFINQSLMNLFARYDYKLDVHH
jgi:Fic family protein